jgi:hypothetical protein
MTKKPLSVDMEVSRMLRLLLVVLGGGISAA